MFNEESTPDRYAPRPETLQALSEALLFMIGNNMQSILNRSGESLVRGQPLDIIKHAFKDETQAASGDTNLPTSALQARLARTDALLAGNTEGAAEHTVPETIRERARTLLGYARACIDLADQDYASPHFLLTPNALLSAAATVMQYEESQMLASDQFEAYLQLSTEIDGARQLAQETFSIVSMEDNF